MRIFLIIFCYVNNKGKIWNSFLNLKKLTNRKYGKNSFYWFDIKKNIYKEIIKLGGYIKKKKDANGFLCNVEKHIDLNLFYQIIWIQ